MKKCVSFSLVLCLVLSLCLLSGCGNKTPQTVDGFSRIMEDAGFQVQDVTASTQTNGLATAVIVALNDDFQIEFWELTDSDVGKSVYHSNKTNLENDHSVKTLASEVSIGNYNYTAFNADGEFHLVARIDNTMLYCTADKEFRSQITELTEALGYK